MRDTERNWKRRRNNVKRGLDASKRKRKEKDKSVGSTLPSFDKLTTPRTVRHDGYPVVGFKYASHQKFILRLYRLAMDNPSYTSTAELLSLFVCYGLSPSGYKSALNCSTNALAIEKSKMLAPKHLGRHVYILSRPIK